MLLYVLSQLVSKVILDVNIINDLLINIYIYPLATFIFWLPQGNVRASIRVPARSLLGGILGFELFMSFSITNVSSVWQLLIGLGSDDQKIGPSFCHLLCRH